MYGPETLPLGAHKPTTGGATPESSLILPDAPQRESGAREQSTNIAMPGGLRLKHSLTAAAWAAANEAPAPGYVRVFPSEPFHVD